MGVAETARVLRFSRESGALLLALCVAGGSSAAGCVPTNTRPHVAIDAAATPLSQPVRTEPVVIEEQVSRVEETATPVPGDDDMYAGLASGDEQRDAFCARAHADVVTDKLCARPSITGLADLERTLGLAFAAGASNGEGGNPAFALLSHSTSLSGRFVSAINPRAFVFTNPASTSRLRTKPRPNPSFVALAFTRGEQFVEIAARDRTTKELRFFLVRFNQACNDGGCTAFDLYSPAVEQNWRQVDVYDDSDLRGTTFDCLVCHQPNGPDSPKMLRMHELQLPWTHFFRDDAPGKRLVSLYYSAHSSTEAYAGIPGLAIGESAPTRLEGLVENEGFANQPNEFATLKIAIELSKRGARPADSATWQALDRGALESGIFPVPFSATSAADPSKIAVLAKAYRNATKHGATSATIADFPPLDDLYSDAARVMAGVAPSAESDGNAILDRMCRRCHNSRLDQSLSRANFNVEKLAEMSADEKEKAIERMRLPATSRRKMPPARAGELTAGEIDRVVAALR
jgi:hypothetical protein